MSALNSSQQPTFLFSIYQNNTWTIRRLVNETIDPVYYIEDCRISIICTDWRVFMRKCTVLCSVQAPPQQLNIYNKELLISSSWHFFTNLEPKKAECGPGSDFICPFCGSFKNYVRIWNSNPNRNLIYETTTRNEMHQNDLLLYLWLAPNAFSTVTYFEILNRKNSEEK